MNKLDTFHYMPDQELVPLLIERTGLSLSDRTKIHGIAQTYVEGFLKDPMPSSMADQFMDKFRMDQPEGMALMALVEAYMRIPDTPTQDDLIADKVLSAEMEEILTALQGGGGNILKASIKLGQMFLKNSLTAGVTKPMMRGVVSQAISILANKYVISPDIEGALKAAEKIQEPYCFSFDMLGEGAVTMPDAKRYRESYERAIQTIAHSNQKERAEISVKLSALHPTYDYAHREKVIEELYPTIKSLCLQAQRAGICLTIDAEEADRLELSLELITMLARDPDLMGWQGLGLAVQAYQRRALTVIENLVKLGLETSHRFRVRLVKGAYWDSEVKWAQERGLKDFPVFTRKAVTDVSYLACARLMLENPQVIFSAFATHNAHTIAAIQHMAGTHAYEFQCLYGMGTRFYEYLLRENKIQMPVRQYAPVGIYEDLLPYLVRRLLENGANSSFLHLLHIDGQSPGDDALTAQQIVADPIEKVSGMSQLQHGALAHPSNIFPGRLNSKGLDLSSPTEVSSIQEAANLYAFKVPQGGETPCHSPIDGRPIGSYRPVGASDLTASFERAKFAQKSWGELPLENRCLILERIADAYELNRPALVALLQNEGGKTLSDAIAEIREAVDFCRYYAQIARQSLSSMVLPGPTGEENTLHHKGRGVFVCISPWNFPLAIFTGQIVAALVSGNAVLAKPSGQTILIAQKAIELMYGSGVPKDALILIPAPGTLVSETLLSRADLGGVCMTGSTQTAWTINRILAERQAAIIPFIAETGGQNAMIVDATALPEQVVKDVITSAFQSAGQRCSALRLLILQEEIAPKILEMLKGAMDECHVGDPRELRTTCGPVIDRKAMEELLSHREVLEKQGASIATCSLEGTHAQGHYVAPCAYQVTNWDLLKEEHFGPILHVMTFRRENLDQVIDQINSLGFGLTFGLQSRIQNRITHVTQRIEGGNIYVNRNMIGAVVGSQPFGGQGFSGTGPKAGGPHYLLRFVHEYVVTINTTAQGGNASLVVQSE